MPVTRQRLATPTFIDISTGPTLAEQVSEFSPAKAGSLTNRLTRGLAAPGATDGRRDLLWRRALGQGLDRAASSGGGPIADAQFRRGRIPCVERIAVDHQHRLPARRRGLAGTGTKREHPSDELGAVRHLDTGRECRTRRMQRIAVHADPGGTGFACIGRIVTGLHVLATRRRQHK